MAQARLFGSRIQVSMAAVIASALSLSAVTQRGTPPISSPVEALLYSTMPSTKDHRPEMAMDTNTGTSYQSLAGMEDGDDFTVLLSRTIPVQGIDILTGDADGTDALSEAFVEASPDGQKYVKLGAFGKGGELHLSFPVKQICSLRIRLNAHRGLPKLVIREIKFQSDVPISHIQYGPGRGFNDISQAPDLAGWCAKAEQQMESFWADTAAMLYTSGLITPNKVNVIYKTGPGVTGVAATGGGVMTVNSKWCRAHPDDTGLTVHEMAHVVQCINAATPGWLIEGTADYIRWVKFEPEHFHPRINVSKATYHDAYQTSATFLGWCTLHYDSQIVTKLNDDSRAGRYKNSLFKKYCGKDIDSLWAEFIEEYKKDPIHILTAPVPPGMAQRILPIVAKGTSIPVNLNDAFNTVGVVADRTRFRNQSGFDDGGAAYSYGLLKGLSEIDNVSYNLGAAGMPNTIACKGNTIKVPAGKHGSLWLLGAAIEGGQKDQTVIVTYTDGSSQSYAQNFSDWYVPSNFPGEMRAFRSIYRNMGDGSKDPRQFYLYSYGFALNPTKAIQSVSLPDNGNVRLLAMSLAD